MEGLWCAISFSLTVGGIDYTSLTVGLTFNSVTTSRTVTVATSTDMIIETMETFTLTLTENDDSVDMLMPQLATVTITDQTSKYIHCYINRIEEYVATRKNFYLLSFLSLCLSSFSRFILLSYLVMTVGFDETVQTVDEGQSVMVTVSMMGESVTLDRDVIVTVMTVDGTANGTDGMM